MVLKLDTVYDVIPNCDESYKRALQRKIAEKLKDKPQIMSVDELVDWKIDLWEYQFRNDMRVNQLFNSVLSSDEVDNFIDTVICNPYIPNVPFYNQALLLLCRGDVLYGGARGGGKALALDTVIPTPTGYTTIGDVSVGDRVIDDTGEACTVVEKSDVFIDHDCYRITFDDGSQVVADGNHRWFVSDNYVRESANNTGFAKTNRLHIPYVARTSELYEGFKSDKLHSGCNNYSIKNSHSCRFTGDYDSDLDYYLLGVWYAGGDGEYITTSIDLSGYTGVKQLATYYYYVPLLYDSIVDCGFSEHHLPLEVLRSSVDCRLAFIQGYLDCGVEVTGDGQYRLHCADDELFEDVCELLCSLGIKVTEVNRTVRNHYIRFATDLEVVRNIEYRKPPSNILKRGSNRYIVDIERIDSVPCQCISVDSPSHLFLVTKSYIPTHNSDSALMSALQYVEFPEWSVGIFRLTYKDLISPGAILSRTEQWLANNPLLEKAGIAPEYSKTKYQFKFPSGATLMFAQAQYDADAEHYQGAELHKLIIDEAVQFSEYKINRLRGSIRKNIDDPLPTEILYTGNPGGISTEYFRENFVEGDGQFIDSKYIDNCYLNFEDYEKRVFEELKDTDPVLYEQWKNGNWSIAYSGSMFKPEWFKRYTTINERIVERVRSWDLAGTDPVDPNGGNDPDYTVGTLFMKGESGRIYVDNIIRFRADPDEVEETILNVARQDGQGVSIVIEQEGGSQAKTYMAYLQRKLQGYHFEALSSRKDKIERAKPMVSAIKFGNMKFRDGEDWFNDMLNEITMFPTKSAHDDTVDSLSLGYNYLTGLGEKPTVSQSFDQERFIQWNNMI